MNVPFADMTRAQAQRTFDIMRASLVVDGLHAIEAARSINMDAVVYDDLIAGTVRRPGRHLLVVTAGQDGLDRAKAVVAGGVEQAHVRFVELEFPLADMVVHQRDRLRWLFSRPYSVMSDRVRWLDQWPNPPVWEPWLTGDENLDSIMRWRPRNLAVLVGDEGSGKSTFSQLFMLKLLSGPTLLNTNVRASVCAWEDDIRVFRRMVHNFGGGNLDSRIAWFEPDRDPERMLDRYLKDIERLTREENVLFHIADPWNAFNHDPAGENETRYVQRMLIEMQRLTQDLGITIMVVTHLPKRQGLKATTGLKPFGISEASGSKEFANKADMGICISQTDLLARLPEMGDDELASIRMPRSCVDGAVAAHGPMLGKAHMVLATDKVKVKSIAGMDDDGLGMGKKAVRAFVFDPRESSLTLDQTATEIARRLWI